MDDRTRIEFNPESWALILGGSSGIGLAAAKKLAKCGMNLFLIHHDRASALPRIENEFNEIRSTGVKLLSLNRNALVPETRLDCIEQLKSVVGAGGRLRLLLHSISRGNLKPVIAHSTPHRSRLAIQALASQLAIPPEKLRETVNRMTQNDHPMLFTVCDPGTPPEGQLSENDFEYTIHAMGYSIVPWVQEVLASGLFAEDARVLGIASEGLERIISPSYSAIAAAKATLESLIRSFAIELAPHGIRANLIQSGLIDTPSSRMIPGFDRIQAGARVRNPYGRLTTPEEIANVIALLCTPEASWINGALIHVDGGERLMNCL